MMTFNNLQNQNGKSMAVSLSGGGHRATLFALGALMYLVDAHANTSVTSIASVSGGSLTNGLVGQTLDFRKTNGTEFRERVAKPLATQIATKGTFFAPLFTKLYLALLIVAFILAIVIAAIAPVPTDWLSSLVKDSLSPAATEWLVMAFSGLVRIILFVVLLMLWDWLFLARGLVCARAFNTTLFSPSGRETKLADIKKENLDHVICSTEFRSAEQVYFAGDFVYSFALGFGVPGDLALARAVQSSADFPGGFPPVALPTKRHNFQDAPPPRGGGPPKPPTKMVLTDGGVYDNMGEQWARGYIDRVGRCNDLAKGRIAPNQLVVVNASARVPWSPFNSRLVPLLGEITSLLRVNNILYINTTNVRRQNIVDSFNPADPTKASSGLPSVLVQIAQSPFRVARAFEAATGDLGERARNVVKFLEAGPNSEKQWSTIANENATVATSLSKFKPEVTAQLIYQGYVVTMCNLHVLFGTDYELFADELAIERFRALIA